MNQQDDQGYKDYQDWSPYHHELSIGLEDDTRVGISLDEGSEYVVVQIELRYTDGRKSEQVWMRIDRETGKAISCTSGVARPGLTG